MSFCKRGCLYRGIKISAVTALSCAVHMFMQWHKQRYQIFPSFSVQLEFPAGTSSTLTRHGELFKEWFLDFLDGEEKGSCWDTSFFCSLNDTAFELRIAFLRDRLGGDRTGPPKPEFSVFLILESGLQWEPWEFKLNQEPFVWPFPGPTKPDLGVLPLLWAWFPSEVPDANDFKCWVWQFATKAVSDWSWLNKQKILRIENNCRQSNFRSFMLRVKAILDQKLAWQVERKLSNTKNANLQRGKIICLYALSKYLVKGWVFIESSKWKNESDSCCY